MLVNQPRATFATHPAKQGNTFFTSSFLPIEMSLSALVTTVHSRCPGLQELVCLHVLWLIQWTDMRGGAGLELGSLVRF